MQNSNTKRLVGVSMLAAVAFVLMFFAFPIIPGVSFLKIDFSDIPVLLGMFLYGPVGGIMVAVIRTVLHYIQTGGDAGYPIGDAASLIASLAYCLPIYYIMRNKVENTQTIVFANVIGTLSLTTILSFLNAYVLIPLYFAVLNFSVGPIQQYVFYGVVPFNLAKGIIVSSVFVILFAKMKPWIVRNQLSNFSYGK
ncbi:MAG: ECF transporter S component [Carnobacterium sp.]|uniref:ECF transporter S component n=1 Tax=unclassified Carnobacterium TaxID=257487 RepID=UPI0019112BD0|nr:ECF transporter S component [Carnobacterium sp. CS13]QQP71144.1 ECF transporter S component [Carnobacterium sp. CS13]